MAPCSWAVPLILPVRSRTVIAESWRTATKLVTAKATAKEMIPCALRASAAQRLTTSGFASVACTALKISTTATRVTASKPDRRDGAAFWRLAHGYHPNLEPRSSLSAWIRHLRCDLRRMKSGPGGPRESAIRHDDVTREGPDGLGPGLVDNLYPKNP